MGVRQPREPRRQLLAEFADGGVDTTLWPMAPTIQAQTRSGSTSTALSGTPHEAITLNGQDREREIALRNLVPPPPVSRCENCSGQLLIKRVEPSDPMGEEKRGVLVCEKCGNEKSYWIGGSPYDPYGGIGASGIGGSWEAARRPGP